MSSRKALIEEKSKKSDIDKYACTGDTKPSMY